MDINAFKQSLAEAKAAVDESEIKKPIEVPVQALPQGASSSGSGADLQAEAKRQAAEKAAEKEAERLQKVEEKEAAALQKKYERLLELTEEFREEENLNQLSADEKKVADLEEKYLKEIEEAKELERKKVEGATEVRLELERLKDEAVNELKEELAAAALEKDLQTQADQDAAETERHIEELKRRSTERAELAAELRTDQENALLEINLHYANLLAIAEEQGLDVTDLERKQQEELARIRKEYADKDLQATKKAMLARLEASRSLYSGLGDLAESFRTFNEEEEEKGLTFQKKAALFKIAVDTAAAISSTIASAAKAGNPIAVAAQIAAGLAVVITNMGRANKILDEANEPVPQKEKRGYHNVKGADDGITYRAQYIGSQKTGMLPSTPVVLASEEGPEYFVDNPSLRNPLILSHVQAIENIKHTKQFRDGGFNNPEGSSPIEADTTSTQNQVLSDPRMFEVMSRLADALEQGIVAVIDDDTIVAIPKKLGELNDGPVDFVILCFKVFVFICLG